MTGTDIIRAERQGRPGVVGATIITHSGLYFDFADPKPEQIVVQDIAWGLANTCRFNGQCNRFYSVAQHSVLASHIVPPEHALAALLHDAAEAYTGDMVKPLKNLLPDFKIVEARVEAAIFDKFGLPHEMSPEIKLADLRLLRTEQRDLTAGAGDNWNGLDEYEPLPERIIAFAPWRAYRYWFERFWALTGSSEGFPTYPEMPTPYAGPAKTRGKKVKTLITDLAEELRRRGMHHIASDIDSFKGTDPKMSDKLAQTIADAIAGDRR